MNMIRKIIALLIVLGLAMMLVYPVTALKVTPKEKVLNYKKGDTIQIQVYVKVETDNETGKYKLEVEEKSGFEWVDDDNDDSETIDTAGEERLLEVKATAEDPSDGNYIFKYHVYYVEDDNGTEVETEVDSGDYEIEIGAGDSDVCGLVFFAIPVVGLVALVAIVRRE